MDLYDCSGNVWEWCYDTWEEKVYAESDFVYDESKNRRVLRGGSWYYDVADCAVSSRGWYDADDAYVDYGFRVVRTL